ncbi:MAG: hypothetical protein QME32_02670 [Endomicrobiia bacterium]|nr:hypothetical protein [Endomicrobiia bacterium]
MKNQPLKFGTDGWRGVIAQDFTFANVARVADGLARYIKSRRGLGARGVVIGYDRRFLSKEFAFKSAETLSNHSINVTLSHADVTTPCIALAAARKKSAFGVMITASHNPPHYNGIKFKTSDGASCPESVTDEIEKLIPPEPPVVPTEHPGTGHSPKIEDLRASYIGKLKEIFGRAAGAGGGLRLAYNPMHGSGAGLLSKALPSAEILEMNSIHDPMFGGLNPEPIEKNLAEFARFTAARKCAAGFALDGDGDRIGMIDDRGRYLTPHAVFPIFLEHLLKNPKTRGCAVQGFALGYLSKRIARAYGVKIIDAPVGFKYVADELMKGGCVIGAEESGGIGFGRQMGYIPERDGLAAAMFATSIIAESGKKLSRLTDEITAKYGESHYERSDVRLNLPPGQWLTPRALYTKIETAWRGAKNIARIDRLDGVKIIFSDESWILVRASGTEPVVRIYCETPEETLTRKLIEQASLLVADEVGP